MNDYLITFSDNSEAIVKAWDVASAYEFAQDIYGKAITKVEIK